MRKLIIPVILALLAFWACSNHSKTDERIAYYYNGKKISGKKFLDKGKNGKIITYYENGNIKSEEKYVRGKPTGIWMEWYKKGNKQYELEHKNGRIQGRFTCWYENGKKKREFAWKDGKRHGKDTYWYPNGNKGFEKQYKNGQRQGQWTAWFPNGRKKGQGNFSDGAGEWVEYYQSGQKKYKEERKDGNLHGKRIEWYENGNNKSEEEYWQDTPQGKWIKWYENGNKKEESTFQNAMRHGNWQGWYENGQKKFAGQFQNNMRQGKWLQWYKNAKPKGSGQFDKGSGTWVQLYENGNKKLRENWHQGQRQGKWPGWDTQGRLIKEETWQNNQLIKIINTKTKKIFSLKSTLDRIVEEFTNPDFPVGVIIGVIKNREKRVFSYGKKSVNKVDSDAPNADTIFEIGSITKTFTTTILADMVSKGEIKLYENVQDYLPGHVTLPTYQGKAINFRHLAAHSSSLPNMPDNLEEAILNPDDPFASYLKYDLYNFLERCSLRYPIGSRGEYSNIGVGLLGHVLGRINHTTYENLLKQRLLTVLAMDNTSLFLTGKQKANLAYGHTPEGEVTANWNLSDCLQGAGAIKSSLHDMVKYLEANMGLIDTPLHHAMEFAQRPIVKTVWGDYNALGWGIETLPHGEKMVWHNGGTAGYRAFIGFIQRLKLGVMVLSNFRDTDMDAIGRNVLRIFHPMAEGTNEKVLPGGKGKS